MKARSAEFIRANDLKAAEQVQHDLATLRGAPGESLYDIYRIASEKSRGLPEPGIFNHWTGPAGTIVTAGGLVVALFGAIPPFLPGVVYPALCVAAGGGALLAVSAYRSHRSSRQQAILQAVKRNQDYVRGYSPSTPSQSFQIDRKVFLAGLQGKEARLAENGQFEQAVQMRQVHERLSRLEGATVEDMFASLVESKDRETIALVQGPCSQQIAETVETLAEVGKLVAPGTLNTVREEQDSLVIGGVVLKKKTTG